MSALYGARKSGTKVALIACGLGRINRGFESTTSNWFHALKSNSVADVDLFGGGSMAEGKRIFNFSRNGWMCRRLRCLGLIHDGCRVEQASFAVGLLPSLFSWRPQVIWFQEYTLGLWLLKWRHWFGFDYRLLYCNGAPLGPREYERFDFIHHLDPQSYRDGLAAGLSAERMTMFPHVLPSLPIVSRAKGLKWRTKQGIPAEAWVVLSAAAWNKHHKRIDYLVREVAGMNDPNVHLLLSGQREAETPDVERLAQEILPGRVHWRTLPQADMPLAYAAADAFVLASLTEAFGLVLIEAAARGLPTLAHSHPAGRFILEDDEWLADLAKPGALTRRLQAWKRDLDLSARAGTLREKVVRRFSAEKLTPQFVALLERVAAMPIGSAR